MLPGIEVLLGLDVTDQGLFILDGPRGLHVRFRFDSLSCPPCRSLNPDEGMADDELVVTEPGSGYSTPPTATVQGMEKVRLTVKIQFNKDLKKNGAVGSIEVE